jgi:hypothetical protein
VLLVAFLREIKRQKAKVKKIETENDEAGKQRIEERAKVPQLKL